MSKLYYIEYGGQGFTKDQLQHIKNTCRKLVNLYGSSSINGMEPWKKESRKFSEWQKETFGRNLYGSELDNMGNVMNEAGVR